MNNKITKKEVMQQFIKAIQFYFEWLEQREGNGFVFNNIAHDSDKKLYEQQLLTVNEVATILYVSKSLVYKMTRQGDKPSIRFGASVRIQTEDLDEFITNNLN